MTDKQNEILHALVLLGVTADRLFDSIREDLELGMTKSARCRLNFLDKLLAEQKKKEK